MQGRAVETDLPFGKGDGTRSDIDIRITHEQDMNSDFVDDLNSVPGVEVRSSWNTPYPPNINITPFYQ
jgi:hypothetical protein